MEWIWADLKIAFVLILWICATYGWGKLALYAFRGARESLSNFSELESFASLALGVALLCFITQVLNIFIPISSAVSVILLILGFTLFVYFYRCKKKARHEIVALLISFLIAGIFSLKNDSSYDTVLYHTQILTWIQESPLVFGLGNIHGRLGFNGIIYNFYALSDVSQIFANLRSFIGNEIMYFGFLYSAICVILRRKINHKANLFLFCALFYFAFLFGMGIITGMYCEPLSALLGILVFALLILILDSNFTKHQALSLFALAFFIAIFAALSKIANSMLVIAIIACFICVFKKEIFKKEFLKFYALLFFATLIFCAPWAIKGMMTSGMLAYPASIGYIESLPWAVSDAQRKNEICWVMSWARAPKKNCAEVLASSEWLKDWLFIRTYFTKYFIPMLIAQVLILIILKMNAKKYLIRTRENMIFAGFFVLFFGAIAGIAFWFYSGPDPRFGMVYIIPFMALLNVYNANLINFIENKKVKVIFIVLTALTFSWVGLGGRSFMLCWIPIFILYFVRKNEKLFYFALICLIISAPLLISKEFKRIAEFPKIRGIFVEEKTTDFGVKIFVRTDKPNENTREVFYEPLPSGPYFPEKVSEGTLFGRKIYINEEKK